ncbi:MAG: ferritin family protein [Leptospirales bacterium]
MLKILFVKFINFWVWRNPKSMAGKLYKFSLAEYGSMLDLMLASHSTLSGERSSMYLRHALDEARHSDLFRDHINYLADKYPEVKYQPEVNADIDNLFLRMPETDFLAFAYRGEKRARIQFAVYRDYFKKKKLKKEYELFAQLVHDEFEHERYIWNLLQELTGSKKSALVKTWKMAVWELGRTSLRRGRKLSNFVFTLTTIILYFISMPIALSIILFKRSKTGWHRETKI